MANFCLGDGRKLGKALPQHKLMQNLLMNDFGKRKVVKAVVKVTTGTQTDLRRVSNTNCCCRLKQSQENIRKNAVKNQIKKFDDEIQNRRSSEGYQNLLASIRERVARNEDDSCCSCSDTWSDNSAGEIDTVHFPQETRNAMSLLLSETKHSRPPFRPISKSPKPCAWPGVAERMDHALEKRLINDEIVTKIMSKLSKNKLDIN